jgi:GTPase Era involved in 16S rRNA processing
MSKIVLNIHLTQVEVDHLLSLLRSNAQEGSYYGRKDQYYDRTKRLVAKLTPTSEPKDHEDI